MSRAWIQVFGSGREPEVVLFTNGEEPSEEDITAFRDDPNPVKHFFRVDLDGLGVIETILDVETGQERTNLPWVRNLVSSTIADHPAE